MFRVFIKNIKLGISCYCPLVVAWQIMLRSFLSSLSQGIYDIFTHRFLIVLKTNHRFNASACLVDSVATQQ